MLLKVKKIIISYLKKKGYTLKKTKDLERITLFQSRVLEKGRKAKLNKSISSIVFSKDRALQLEAFISSYNLMVASDNSNELHILYHCTSLNHQKSYQELIRIYSSSRIIFHKEQEFKSDLLKILDKNKSKITGLFVDDMIFIDRVNLSQIKQIDISKYVLALSRGADLNYCVPLSEVQEIPQFFKKNTALIVSTGMSFKNLMIGRFLLAYRVTSKVQLNCRLCLSI